MGGTFTLLIRVDGLCGPTNLKIGSRGFFPWDKPMFRCVSYTSTTPIGLHGVVLA
jgi:hypothetical protein